MHSSALAISSCRQVLLHKRDITSYSLLLNLISLKAILLIDASSLFRYAHVTIVKCILMLLTYLLIHHC